MPPFYPEKCQEDDSGIWKASRGTWKGQSSPQHGTPTHAMLCPRLLIAPSPGTGHPLLEVKPQNTENKEAFPVSSARNTPYNEREVQKPPKGFSQSLTGKIMLVSLKHLTSSTYSRQAFAVISG